MILDYFFFFCKGVTRTFAFINNIADFFLKKTNKHHDDKQKFNFFKIMNFLRNKMKSRKYMDH